MPRDAQTFGAYMDSHVRAQTAWRAFHDARKSWDALIDREAPVELPDDVTGGQDPIDMQSTDLETDLFTHVSACIRNPTYFDVVLLSPGTEDNKKTARDVLLWLSRTWLDYNEGRSWDEGAAEGQARYGAYISRQLYREWMEPDTKAVRTEGKSASYTREQAMKRMRFQPFYHQDVLPASYCALERGREAPIAFYEYDMPVIEAWRSFRVKRQLREDGGRYGSKKYARPSVGAGNRLEWVGEDDEPNQSLWDNTVRCVVVDAEDPEGKQCPIEGCKHTRRIITEYIYGTGDSVKDAERVEEYASPYQYSSFVVVPCFRSIRRDPHKRYRPLMLGEYDKISRRNYYDTTIVTMARSDYGDGNWAIDPTKVPEHLTSWWNEFSEGGKKLSIERPEPGEGRIPIIPAPTKLPKEISPHLLTLREANEVEMQSVKPNPYITGAPFMESQTATQYTTGAQTAQIDYSRMLTASDASRQRIVSEWLHAIRYWAVADKGKETEPRYYAAASGNETPMSAGFKPGETAWVSASKLDSIEFEVVLKTESETIQEEVARWQLAKDKWHEGVLTPEDYLRASGQRDVERYKQELKVAQIRAEFDPELRPLRVNYVKRRLELRSQLKFAQVGTPGMLPPGQPSMNGNGAQPPGMGMSQQQITGQHMTPALIQGPEGQAAPMQEGPI